ncbi:TPA: hypothetical protein ACH3X2_001352 [Trebouxia sp. C0005]
MEPVLTESVKACIWQFKNDVSTRHDQDQKNNRSCSTWLFNAIRLLLKSAQILYNPYWNTSLDQQKLQQRKEAACTRQACCRWSDVWDVGQADHIFLTHCDLQGVVASYRRDSAGPSTSLTSISRSISNSRRQGWAHCMTALRATMFASCHQEHQQLPTRTLHCSANLKCASWLCIFGEQCTARLAQHAVPEQDASTHWQAESIHLRGSCAM